MVVIRAEEKENMEKMVAIHMLTEADAPAFRTLRLRSLREHPEAFGSSSEEEELLPVEQTAEHLRSSSAERCAFGAIATGQLVGYAGFSRHPRRKTCHKAHIGGMYVVPEARSQGVGRALLDAVVTHARSMSGVEEVVLAVTVGNEPARRLYIAGGFKPYCIEPRYIKVDGEYFDIEWMILRFG